MPTLTKLSQTLVRLEDCASLTYKFLESGYYNLAILLLSFLPFQDVKKNASGVNLNDLLTENKWSGVRTTKRFYF